MPFAYVNGISLHYAAIGDGPPLVFLHGLGSSASDWALQVPFFARHYRVLTLDLRGHGQSTCAGPLSVESMADDVAGLLAQFGEPPAHVVGLSLGGCVALALALRHPGRVRSLTLVNTFARFRPHGWDGVRQGLTRVWLLATRPMPEVAAYVARRLFPRPEQRPLYEAAVASLSRNSKRAYFASLRALRRFDVEKQLVAIRCPTLIVAGDRDLTLPLTSKAFLHRAISGARLHIISDSGHATPYDQHEIFNRSVREFVEAVDDGRETRD